MDKCILVIGFILQTSAVTYNQHWQETNDWYKPQTEWPKPQGEVHKPYGEWHRPQQYGQHSHGDYHEHYGDWQAPHGEWHAPHGEWHDSNSGWHNTHEDYHKPHGECHESHEVGHVSHGSYGEQHNSYYHHGNKPQGSPQWNSHEYDNFNFDEKHRTLRSFQFPGEESDSPNPILILECLVQCPFSQKVAPVCGTNQFTYGNVGKLLCAKKCGVVVDLLHTGPCSENPGTDTNVPETPDALIEPARVSTEQCLSACRRTTEYNPVCGTDYILYDNIGTLECARQYCGLNVQLLQQSFCPLPPTPNPQDTNSQTPVVPNLNPQPVNPVPDNPGPVTPEPVSPNIIQIEQCLTSCPSTSEYDPVCGTDLAIYQNLSKLQCATRCGADVSLLQVGNCPKGPPVVNTAVPTVVDTATPPAVTVPPELSFDVRVKEENKTANS